jgi:alginate O-acetyltransferase complex protein AlgI
MELSHLLIFIAFGLVYALIVPGRWRAWALLVASVYAIYALQPTLDVRFLDFGLPTATLIAAVYGWLLTRSAPITRFDGAVLALIAGLALLLTVPRYLADFPVQPTSRPPDVLQVALGLGLAAVGGAVIALLAARRAKTGLLVGMVALVALFVVLQTEPLATALAALLRTNTGQNTALASPLDVGWLGFSYVAFRILHTLRDRQTGLLPPLNLRDYLIYIIFFPAYTSGPIDRAERFAADMAALPALRGMDADRLTRAGVRIASGLFKKFVIADSLALFALNATAAAQTDSAPALWLMLYAYAFRLLFDFSGYTDIAIGVGMLFGVQLPENFDRPYARSHIAAFWQSWHMTLSSWARFYIYSPLSRALIKRRLKPGTVAAVCNLATMLTIGLWHGVTLPFALWGAWHGVGLTVHKLWSDRTRKWYRGLKATPRRALAWQAFTTLLTFHFVLLGWVWFALPDIGTAWRVFAGLFGVRA